VVLITFVMCRGLNFRFRAQFDVNTITVAQKDEGQGL